MKTEIEEVSQLPAIIKPIERSAVMLMPVMDLNTAKSRLREFQEFVDGYLSESQDGGQDGGDYGVIPGTKKKTLLKSGADKLCELYGLYDEYVTVSTVEDWDKGLFDYTLKCILKSRRDDSMVGTGMGSCSSFESKYRWREQKRKCPSCGMEIIIKGKEQYGGGWLCWKKQGGCGTTFKDGDKSIEGQVIGRVENPDIIDMKNTVLKIAKKRAKIDAVIGVTRSSGIFAQDLDDVVIPGAQAPKKTVEVTETDIEIGGPGKSAGGGDFQSTLIKDPSPPTTADEYISEDDAKAIYIHARSFLDKSLHKYCRALVHDWCQSKGLIDVKGDGTLLKVRKVYIENGREVSGVERVRQALEEVMKDRNAEAATAK